MKQGKYQGTHRSGPGPSVGCEQLVQREPAGHGHQAVPLHVYHDQTQPLIDYYTKEGILKSVDGTKDLEEVFADIVAILGE